MPDLVIEIFFLFFLLSNLLYNIQVIKAVVLDIDGVIVGNIEGVNFPNPKKDVVEGLRRIKEKGISVSLCTGKAAFAIEDVVKSANLDNIHIAEGGAVGFNPINGVMPFQYAMERDVVMDLFEFYKKNDIYMEFYTSRDYFVFGDQEDNITKMHGEILGRMPKSVSSGDFLREAEIVKIVLMLKDEEQKKFVERTFSERFGDKLSLNWAFNLSLVPWKIGLITKRGVSKRTGVKNIAKFLDLELENILGVGDSMHDWNFIDVCGYGATLSDSDIELKNLIRRKKNGFVGGGVNEDGILDILRHFKLL